MVAARFFPACAVLLAASSFAGTSAKKRELTPEDAIATVRVTENHLTSGERIDSGITSPDGRRFLLRLVHGDVKRNGVWMDLFSGTLNSLEAAAHPRPCAHLFTTGLGSTKAVLSGEADSDSTNLVHWINDSQVAFLWSNSNAVRQVMSVDVISCKTRFLTHSTTDVFSFMFAPGGELLFNVQVPRAVGASRRLWNEGFTVSGASDGWTILKGQIDGADANSLYDNAWFIRSAGRTRGIDIAGQHTDPIRAHRCGHYRFTRRLGAVHQPHFAKYVQDGPIRTRPPSSALRPRRPQKERVAHALGCTPRLARPSRLGTER
jgi:hypothetical protein